MPANHYTTLTCPSDVIKMMIFHTNLHTRLRTKPSLTLGRGLNVNEVEKIFSGKYVLIDIFYKRKVNIAMSACSINTKFGNTSYNITINTARF